MADEPRSIIPTLPEKDPDEPLPLPVRDKQPDASDMATGTDIGPQGTQVIPPPPKPAKPGGTFKPPMQKKSGGGVV